MSEARRFYVITGGTMVHVAPHFSFCAPAYGAVGASIYEGLKHTMGWSSVVFLPTRMAGELPPPIPEVFQKAGIRFLETNEDLEKLVDYLISCPDTKGIVMAAAVCDWVPTAISGEPSEFGKSRSRLRTSGGKITLELTPSDKIIQKIRQKRKDIFLVGFKATTGLSEQEQYIEGLRLLKTASCNLVFANDVHEHRNMVITPEEAKYYVGKDRSRALSGLCEMIAKRSNLTFTRSVVIPGDAIPWSSPEIPDSLRKVVDHCIARGAYKPFLGKTVGHFATRGPSKGTIYTSRRKSNFNNLGQDGLLRIDAVDDNTVVAHGGKPSVGGQSQRIIFAEHPEVDCIVHMHVPLRLDAHAQPYPPVREQRLFECGSHECGRNTSNGLRDMINPGNDNVIKAVMLDEHGPNICFSKRTDPQRVIEFIETFWDLEQKTGGPVDLGASQ